MIDPRQLTVDIAGTVIAGLLPWVLWLLLFLWAWERPEAARRAGFGRRTFWLLLPVAALASLANTPLLDWSGSVLAMNAGGALLPLILAAVLLYHAAPSNGRTLVAGYFLTAAALSGALFLCLFLPLGGFSSGSSLLSVLGAPAVPGGAANWLFVALVVLWPLLAASSTWTSTDPAQRQQGVQLAGLTGLTGLGILLTFYTSQAVPNEGIISTFPAYLIAPLLVGLLAGVLAWPLFGLSQGAGMSIAYAASTVGVLVGADVLREPPLYNGAPAVLSIGGAGIADLVYLTGLLAVGAAFLVIWVQLRGHPEEWGHSAVTEPRGARELWRRAVRMHAQGRYREAIQSADAATHEAGEQLHRLGLAPAEETIGTWAEFGPAWLEPDRRNLAHLASVGSDDPQDSARGILAARLFLDRAGTALRSRFAPLPRRCLAFSIDLAVLTVPALAVWALLIHDSSDVVSLLTGLPFGVAVFGYLGFGFLYFLIGDALWGSSVGKQLLGLRVKDRALGAPGLIPAFLRSAPKLVPLALIGEGGAVALALLLSPSASPLEPLGPVLGFATGLLLLVATVVGVFLVGLVSVLTILATPERQRIGDLWAGTWVMGRAPATRAESVPPPVSVPSG
ncbi:MAG: DUF1614 domain-containing protein [Thermoplasmata archaeon]|nr:DUF1614 domain-containing protein [Thermoplasmata archaeon]